MGCNSGLTSRLFCFLILVIATSAQELRFLERPKDTSARVGGNATFVCRLNDPDAEIAWQKGDILIAVNDRLWVERVERFSIVNKYDLIIRDIVKEDNGDYTCRANDGNTVVSARLTVLLHPETPQIEMAGSTPFKEGDQIAVNCSSKGGNPPPTITWLKNGNPSFAPVNENPAKEVGGVTSSILSLTLDKSDHQANFSCLVYNVLNQNNRLTAYTVLNVQYTPAIGFRPYSPVYHVRRGSDIDLVCDVDANPAVTQVTWYRDANLLSGNSPTRTITNVQETDGGMFNCTAQNDIGVGTGSLLVDVQYPPILQTPPTMTVNEGDDINIECEIQANPNPYEVQWSRVSSNGAFRTVTNTAELNLPAVGREKAGNYSCSARSQMKISGESLQMAQSETFTYVYVRYKPGKASIGSVPDIYVGERLVLSCTATPAGYPEALYIWSKDGESLSTSGQTYTKNSVTLDDNGRYSCTPSNSRGTGDMASLSVNVYEPPTITQQPEYEISVMLTFNKMVTFTCVAHGYPEPQVTWYQEGDSQALNLKQDLFKVIKTTSTDGTYRMRVQSVLQFIGDARDLSTTGERTMLKIRDLGNYTCQAESNKHTDIASAVSRLVINFPPVLVDTPTRYARTRLDAVELLCEAQGNPIPTFQWFFKGSRMDSSQVGMEILYSSTQHQGRASSRLKIESVSDKTYGTYLCVITNALGNASEEISLSPRSRPEQVENLQALSSSWESVLLSWQPGFDGGYEQRFFINQSSGNMATKQISVLPISATTYNVSELRPSTNYTFQVLAANRLGLSLFSAPVRVTTKGLQIPSLPEVPQYNLKQQKLLVLSPDGYRYCLRVEVQSRGSWDTLNGCMKVMGDTLEINRTHVTAINVSVCLSHRTDVCGQPVTATIHSTEKDPVLTETHVIIIACVCALIIIALLIILFCFICRRRRNAAKASQAGNAWDPPPYQAVPPSKKPQQGYDNQGMDTSDLAVTQISHAPSAPLPESDNNNTNNHLPVHANPSYSNTSYGPLEFYGGTSIGTASGAAPPPRSPLRQLSPRSLQLADHHQMDNEVNRWRENNRMDNNFPNRDMLPTSGSVPHSPTKDKYIDLQDRTGMDANDQGYPPAADQGGGKPKKRVKWRWLWRKEKPVVSTPPAFSHNPPGHTCGLPCCQQDNDITTNPATTQRGCVMVPVFTPLELSESNFVMKRVLRPSSLFGCPISSTTQKFFGRMSKSMQDMSNYADRISDDEYEEDSEGRRIIKFKHRSDIIAPAPSADLLALHGLAVTEESATLLRRQMKSTPWKNFKDRHFTFPDSPRTQYRIMFLNHTPGESTDSFEGEIKSGLTSLAGTLKKQEDQNSSEKSEEKTNEADITKEDGSNISVFSTDPNVVEISGKAGVRRSIVETSLPPVPVEEKNVMSFTEATEEDDDEEDDGEHIYDVVKDVKAESEKLARVEEDVAKTEHPQQQVSVSSSSEIAQSDSNSTTYQASVSDCLSYTESYIYNGSLFSQCTDSSFDQSIYYPGSLLRHRSQMTLVKRPTIFMIGGKPVILPKTDELSSEDSKLDSSSMSCQSGLSGQKAVPRVNISFDKDSKSSNYGSSQKEMSAMDVTNSTPVDLDSKFTTKLKLWDLRLLTINREENQYSTFPPRNPTCEDLCVGFFTRRPEFGYRHRHNSDVTTDNYVTHKINRILRAPVLTKSNVLTKFASGDDHLNLFDSLASRSKTDPIWDNEDALERWKQALILNNRGKLLADFNPAIPDAQYGRSENLSQLVAKKPDFESNSSIYEPLTLSGIYKLGEKREEDLNSSLFVGPHRQHVDSLLVRKGSRKGASVSNYDGSVQTDADGVQRAAASGSGEYISSYGSIYGGSLYGSTFGWHVSGQDGQKGSDKSERIDEDEGKDKGEKDMDRPVIWGDPSVVDWRHQAELFKDKSFITLIL